MYGFPILPFLVLFAFSIAKAENPSISLNLTEKVIENIKNYVLPTAISKILSMPLPDISENFWPYTITISKLRVQELSLNASDISINLIDSAISVKVQHVSLVIVGDFCIKSLISNEATLNIALNDISIDLFIFISLNKAQKFQITISSVSVNICSFKLSIDGSFFLYFINIVINLMQRTIKNEIQTQIALVLQKQVPVFVNNLLTTIPNEFNLPISSIVPLSLSIEPSEAPILQINSIEFGAYVYIYNNLTNKTTPPISLPSPFHYKRSYGKEIQVTISQYLINSAFFAFIEPHVLNYTIIDLLNNNQTLTTDYINFFLPGVVEKFGSNKMVTLFCSLPMAPELDFAHPIYDINLLVNASCDIRPVIDYNPITIGTLTLALNVSLDIQIKNNTFAINFTQTSCQNLDIINTNFTQKQHLDDLQNLIKLGLEFALEPIKPRIEIPKYQGISFNDIALEFGDGFISIEVSPDFSNWTPPTSGFLDSIRGSPG